MVDIDIAKTACLKCGLKCESHVYTKGAYFEPISPQALDTALGSKSQLYRICRHYPNHPRAKTSADSLTARV